MADHLVTALTPRVLIEVELIDLAAQAARLPQHVNRYLLAHQRIDILLGYWERARQ